MRKVAEIGNSGSAKRIRLLFFRRNAARGGFAPQHGRRTIYFRHRIFDFRIFCYL